MASEAERDLIRNFVTELQPILAAVDRGAREFSVPDPDTIVVGQAIQALSTLRSASTVLELDGFVRIADALIEVFEAISNPAYATPRTHGEALTMAQALREYADGLASGARPVRGVTRALAAHDAVFASDDDAQEHAVEAELVAPTDLADGAGASVVEREAIDPEVRDIFLEEAADLVDSFTHHALELARAPQQHEALVGLRRDAHTLKGAANMTGFPLVGQVGAAVEDLIDAHLDADAPVDRPALEVILVARRFLTGMLQQLDDLSRFSRTVDALQQRSRDLSTMVSAAPSAFAERERSDIVTTVTPLGADAQAYVEDDEAAPAQPVDAAATDVPTADVVGDGSERAHADGWREGSDHEARHGESTSETDIADAMLAIAADAQAEPILAAHVEGADVVAGGYAEPESATGAVEAVDEVLAGLGPVEEPQESGDVWANPPLDLPLVQDGMNGGGSLAHDSERVFADAAAPGHDIEIPEPRFVDAGADIEIDLEPWLAERDPRVVEATHPASGDHAVAPESPTPVIDDPDLFALVSDIATYARIRNELSPDDMVVIPDDLDGLSEDITALSAEFENAELPAMLAGIGDGTASAFDSAGVDYERDAAAAGDPNPGEAPEDLPGTSPLDATTPADAAADGPFTAAEGDWRVSDAASADALVDDVIQESEPETAPAPVSSATPFGSRSIELGSALLNLAFSAEGFLAAEDGWQAPAVEHGAGDAVQDRDGVSEVFDTFATEAAEHIDVLGRAAMQLERDPAAPEPLREIVRTLHTLKGAAAAAGSEPIAERCHALEDALAELERTSSRPGRAFVDSLYAMVDEVEALIASTRQGDGQMVDLTDQRGAAAAGGDLRVNIQRVDSLLNLVGELVVNRAAFEQRLLRFGATIDELALSAERLRRSSQNLDRGIAGSSSLTFHAPATLFPSNGLAAHGGEFDALEMDRYSEYDRIVRELLEIASDVGAAAGELGQLRGDLETVSTRQQRLTSALQDELMDVRMVPFGTIAPRLHRVVRGVADERGKDVELVFEGSATPFDKAMLEALSDSLLHLLRNAVDHGVERPDQRAAAGKPRRGTIRVRSYRDGNQVVIEVLDDGRGIDHQQVIERARALEHPVHDEMTRGEALQLIFLPGFTTRDSIDAVSGRGVGLEIVKAAVARLKGRITVDSQPGAGTAFRLRMPIMLAVAQAFMVTAGGRRFAVPAGSVELVADRAGARISRVGDTMVLDVGDAVMPLIDLGERLDGRGGETLEQPNGWLLITRIGDERWAIRVDGLEGQQEIVVKPLGRFLKNVPSVVGATILGNGDIALILDIQQLTGVSARVRADIVEALGGDEAVEPPVATSATRVALIVDDSLSVRRVLGRTLARHGWETLLARDGVEALDTLERNVVDVIVTDIEMPRMDGFELMSAIRRHAKAATTPVVVLTSRSGDKHRAKAFEMGANAYLIKPFQEQELLDTLAREARLPMRAAR